MGIGGELHPVHITLMGSRNVAAALVVAALMALDLLAFEHGHWLALFISSGLLVAWIGGATLQRIPRYLTMAGGADVHSSKHL
jgi:hypothetical protein